MFHFTLRAHTGHHLSITDDQEARIVENHDRWERFKFLDENERPCVPANGQKVAIQSVYHKTWISCSNNGTIDVATHQKDWEMFTYENIDDKITLRSHHGTYISVSDKNNLVTAEHPNTWEQFTAIKYRVIHSFDLGGGGLKYCFWHCKHGTEIFERQSEEESSIEQGLKYCPNSKSPAQWIREKITNFDQCVNVDGALIGFSLAGMDKLWVDQTDRSEGRNVQELFGITASCSVYDTGDGVAQMIGAKHFLESQNQARITHPHINFALGTGVGMGASNSNGDPRNGNELVFDVDGKTKEAWSLIHPSTGRKVWDVLGKNGVNEHGPEQFARHWREFYDQVWIKLYAPKNWTKPATISFTGGCLRIDGVASAMKEMFPECQACLFDDQESGNAGLLGAAVSVFKKRYDDTAGQKK